MGVTHWEHQAEEQCILTTLNKTRLGEGSSDIPIGGQISRYKETDRQGRPFYIHMTGVAFPAEAINLLAAVQETITAPLENKSGSGPETKGRTGSHDWEGY